MQNQLRGQQELSIATELSAAEANHRIANNLAILAGLIRSQLFALGTEVPLDPGVLRRSLQGLILKIDGVARLHRLLVNVRCQAHVELGAYLHEIADTIRIALATDDRIQCRDLCDGGVFVSAGAALAIGAITAEALTNSIKYSGPDHGGAAIVISWRRIAGGDLCIEVANNDFLSSCKVLAQRNDAGCGRQLMSRIAAQLNAKLHVTQIGGRYVVELLLPERYASSVEHCSRGLRS